MPSAEEQMDPSSPTATETPFPDAIPSIRPWNGSLWTEFIRKVCAWRIPGRNPTSTTKATRLTSNMLPFWRRWLLGDPAIHAFENLLNHQNFPCSVATFTTFDLECGECFFEGFHSLEVVDI